MRRRLVISTLGWTHNPFRSRCAGIGSWLKALLKAFNTGRRTLLLFIHNSGRWYLSALSFFSTWLFFSDSEERDTRGMEYTEPPNVVEIIPIVRVSLYTLRAHRTYPYFMHRWPKLWKLLRTSKNYNLAIINRLTSKEVNVPLLHLLSFVVYWQFGLLSLFRSPPLPKKEARQHTRISTSLRRLHRLFLRERRSEKRKEQTMEQRHVYFVFLVWC